MAKIHEYFAAAILGPSMLELCIETSEGDRIELLTLPISLAWNAAEIWKTVTSQLARSFEKAGLASLGLAETHFACGVAIEALSSFRQKFQESAPAFRSLELASDAHMSLLGAHGGGAGLILKIDSSVVTQFFDEARLSHRRGGWGFPFDAGGSSWIGWQALSQTLALLDGKTSGSESLLHQELLDACGGSPDKIKDWLRSANHEKYGQLARLVVAFAAAQDPGAAQILKRAGQEIGDLVQTLDKENGQALCLTGDFSAALQPYLPEWLQNRIKRPEDSALQGAMMLARNRELREICVEPQISWQVQSPLKLKESIDSLKPDLESSTPLYVQLQMKLMQAIQKGLWRPGNALPSERYLSDHLGVSRITVRKAFDLLLADGLLEKQQGAGTFVKRRVEQPISVLTGFSDEMKARGLAPETRTLECFVRTATAEEALILNLKPGQQVAYLKRLRLADNMPVAVEYNVLPRHLIPDPQAIEDSLYKVLRAKGLMPTRALQQLRANIVSSGERDLLQAGDDTPVLYITRIGYLENGVPIEYTHSYYRGDRYDFIAELQGDKIQGRAFATQEELL